jgi:hypothetical protein
MCGLVQQNGDLPQLNAITILGSTDRGIHRLSHAFSLPKTLGLTKYPVVDIHHTIVPKQGRRTFEAPKFVSVCSPPGAVTEPHIDAPGIGMIIVPISGHKLWFLWPPNARNLHWMGVPRDASQYLA